jgi:hypothetical protein
MMRNIQAQLVHRPLAAMVGATLLAAAAGLAGCQNDAQAGAGIGAGLGAIAGAVIGHNSGDHAAEGAAIGAGIGALGGYIAGNESDKARDRRGRDPNFNY